MVEVGTKPQQSELSLFIAFKKNNLAALLVVAVCVIRLPPFILAKLIFLNAIEGDSDQIILKKQTCCN